MTVASEHNSLAVLAWLQALDPDEVFRRELAHAGVARHTIYTLYPESFTLIVPGLCDYLRAITSDSLRERQEEFDLCALDLRSMVQVLPAELEENYRVDFSNEREPSIRQLRATLNPLFKTAGLNPDSHIFAASSLWYSWWFLRNRDQLPEIVLDTVDSAALWIGEHLLQVPLLTSQDLA